MAELVGTIVAAAQAAEYCLKLYTFFDRALRATDTLQRYLNIIQESHLLLAQISINPSLQTAEIQKCTNTFFDIIKSIDVPDNPQKKSRLLASIAIAVKQKRYDEIFALLEEKKLTLSLFIANSNSTLLNDIQADVKHLRIQSDQGLIKTSVCHDMTTQIANESRRLQSPNDTRNYFEPRDSTYGTVASLPSPDLQLIKQRERRLRHAADKMSQSTDNKTPLFKGNENRGSATQVVGTSISKDTPLTDKQLVEMTSGMKQVGNKQRGTGEQVIGQRVRAGATPRKFGGLYSKNVNYNTGDQIIGLSF